MNAWVVAGGVLVAVLGFEVLMFRYVGAGPASASARSESATEPTGEDVGATGPGAAGRATPACRCHDCGAANDDSPAVRYCWHCLTRLR